MTVIKDKKSDLVCSNFLPREFAETPVKGDNSTLWDLVVSYLPKAFDTLTRGINNAAFRGKVVEALPMFSKTTIVDEVCSYLDNRETMLDILAGLPESDSRIAFLMARIENGLWFDPLFAREDTDLYLLEAVRRGLITQYEFSSLTLLMMARKTAKSNPVIMPLLRGDQIDETAEQLIKESFLLKKVEGVFDKPAPLLTEGEFQAFIKELRKFPRTEQMIYLIPFTGERTILPFINKLGLNLFGKVTYPHTIRSNIFGIPVTIPIPHSMMVAPLGMVQAFLNVKFGSEAVELLPAIGPTPFISELRENGLYGTRVVGIDSSILDQLTGLTFPNKADGFEAPGVYFTYHDACYHGYLASSIPRTLRKRFISFFDFTKEKRALLTSDQASSADKDLFLRKLGFKFADMEHGLFRPEIVSAAFKTPNMLSVFWDNCADHIQTAAKDKLCLITDTVKKWRKALEDHEMFGEEDREAIRSEIFRLQASPRDRDLLRVLQLMNSPTD